MWRFGKWTSAFGLLLPLVACGGEGGSGSGDLTLAVDLRTDLVPVEEFDRVQLILIETSENVPGRRREVEVDAEQFLPGRRLAELEDLLSGNYRLDVQLEDSERGRVIAKHPVLLSLTENLALTVPVDRSCQNVACPPLDDPNTEEDESTFIACLGGQCVDPKCTLETPEFCGNVDLCEADDDCVPEASCAAGECVLGVCWARPKTAGEAGACGGGDTWCHPETQCFSLGVDPPEFASCDDGVRNGDETGVDCGGDCDRCTDVFSSVVNDSCINGVQDADEDGIDCGRGCTPCQDTPYNCATDQSAIAVHECRALLAIYNSMLGDDWSNNSGWLQSGTSPCDWNGITCSGNAVVDFDLGNNGLSGAFPAEIGNLREVTRFDVESNNIGGSLPREIGKMTNLNGLLTNVNELSGPIPSEIGDLQNLEAFIGGNCNLSGPIPTELGNATSLRALTLEGNELSGEIPDSIGNLVALDEIRLENNNLIGELPASLGNLVAIDNMSFHNNNLSGQIPASLGGIPGLRNLRLQGNQLSGPVPPELMDATVLTGLSLENNACLYATECVELKPWLDSLNSTWQSSNTDPSCDPPENACP